MVWEEEEGDGVSRLVLNLGERIVVGGTEPARVPTLASSGDQALLVWVQQKGYSYQLLASRMNSRGEVLDVAPLRISDQVLPSMSSIDTEPSRPAVVWTGDAYMVVWTDMSTQVRLARVTREGVVLEQEVLIASPLKVPQLHPAIAMGSGVALIVWQDGVIYRGCNITCPPPPPPGRILALRVSPNGQRNDPAPLPISAWTSTEFRPTVAWNGRDFLVGWIAQYQNRIEVTRVPPVGPAAAEISVIREADDRPNAVRLTALGSSWFVAWNEAGTLRGRLIDPLGRPDGAPVILSSSVTATSPPYLASNGSSSILVAYQRVTTERTNVPRLFYRMLRIDPPRARAVR
jgi:hypothetical protein